ncbi:hypothetical protein MOQ95_002224 [Salmonella enterica]|nr:hypothetical protein [Salmonella enterica]
MKRLTNERVAALIDMVPLNETIADIKSALVELQERRKAVDNQDFPDLKSEESSLPVSKFDNEYIRTRLQVFDDTDEIVGWLSDLADEYYEEQNFAEEYNLREAVTSLCGMYADLKDFGNELIRLQGNQAPVRQPASSTNSPVIPEGWALVPKKLTTEMRKAAREVFGIDDIDIEWSHLLAAAPKPENAND